MTRRAVIFILSSLFVYFLAGQTQIGWLYLVVAIIWSLILLAAIIPRFNLRALQVERQVLLPADRIHHSQLDGPLQDEGIEIVLRVTNSGRLGRYFITAVEECPFEQPEKQSRSFLLSNVRPRATTTFSYNATCFQRGYYQSAGITLESSDPFGLFVRRRRIELPLNLTVYPAFFELEGVPSADTSLADWGHAFKSSVATEFYGSKEYQPGDPLKNIHWRNTARVGNFMLKEFEQAGQGSITVVFKTSPDYGIGRETTLEYSIQVAATLARLCTKTGCSLDIIAGENHLYNAGWRESMGFLAHLEASEKEEEMDLLKTLSPDSTIVAVFSEKEKEIFPSLLQASNRVRNMSVIILENFLPDEANGGRVEKSPESIPNIISCSPGGIKGAIETMADILYFNSKSGVSAG